MARLGFILCILMPICTAESYRDEISEDRMEEVMGVMESILLHNHQLESDVQQLKAENQHMKATITNLEEKIERKLGRKNNIFCTICVINAHYATM